VANVDEGTEEVPAALAEHARTVGAGVVAVSARIEAELAALDPDEAEAMRAELGAGEPGLTRVIRGAFALLDLIAFFTADADKPAQSRHLRRGLTAWHAAGVVHTDMQRGFVRAEVVAWDELVDAGGYAAARERGTLRIEGRDYVVADGDVVHIRFTR
jgi:ribosome-binding ATPase YchF (GTP1/OBG family)